MACLRKNLKVSHKSDGLRTMDITSNIRQSSVVEIDLISIKTQGYICSQIEAGEIQANSSLHKGIIFIN